VAISSLSFGFRCGPCVGIACGDVLHAPGTQLDIASREPDICQQAIIQVTHRLPSRMRECGEAAK
jgi:hypothetical protein